MKHKTHIKKKNCREFFKKCTTIQCIIIVILDTKNYGINYSSGYIISLGDIKILVLYERERLFSKLSSI